MLARVWSGTKHKIVSEVKRKMKKTLSMAAFVAVCGFMSASSAFGSQLNAFCTPTGTFSGGTGGPITETCGSFSNIGGGTIGSAVGQDTITSVEIYLVSDYQVGFTGSQSVSVTYGTPSAGSFTVPGVDPCVVTGASSSSANTCGSYSGTLNTPGTEDLVSTLTGAALQTFAASNFTDAVSSVVTTGSVQTSAGDIIVEYDYVVNSGVPEPATFGLVGSALLGLGLISRKRFSR